MKITYSLIFFLSVLFNPLNLVFGINRADSLVVALDGSGDYKSIQEAVTACGAFPSVQKTIFIKNGIYKEKVLIDSFYSNIKLIGESNLQTIISFNNYAGQAGIGTFNSYTLKVSGDNIQLENLTIENSAGKVGQAVALHVEGDCFVAYNCRILGNQDTLYASGDNRREYFKKCYIAGTTDYIFGSAIAVFEDCDIHSLTNSFITAANTPKENQFGFVFLNCKLTAESGVDQVYLGRPWRDYANVVFINCFMGKHITPEGWHNWDKPEREKTSFFAEFDNKGLGADLSKRVKWFHLLKKSQIKKYRLETIFSIDSKWSF